MNKRKGIQATNFIIALVVGLLLLLILTPIAIEFIKRGETASQGCSTLASIIQDMMEISLCG